MPNSTARKIPLLLPSFIRLIQVRPRQLLCLSFIGMFLGSILSGCSPVYVLRAAYEEGKILWRRTPIVDYAENPDVELATQEKLKTVLAVREYARTALKLNVGV